MPGRPLRWDAASPELLRVFAKRESNRRPEERQGERDEHLKV